MQVLLLFLICFIQQNLRSCNITKRNTALSLLSARCFPWKLCYVSRILRLKIQSSSNNNCHEISPNEVVALGGKSENKMRKHQHDVIRQVVQFWFRKVETTHY